MSRNRARSRARALSIFSDSAINLDFIPIAGTSPALDPRITFTRSTTGTYVNSAGVITSAAINQPRFDYDPVTRALKGLLIEEQRTNSIRNNTMQGAVVGTPGTLPTNWAGSSPIAGLTREVIGTGTQNGINYIDVRFSGTTNTTSANIIFAEPNNSVAALNGQSWAASSWIAFVGGSFTNITSSNLVLRFNDVAGALLTSSTTSFLGATATQVRYAAVGTASNASTAFVTTCITLGFNNGVAIDITLRIGLPQLELGAFATSVIPTTTAAVTRAADLASMTGTNFSSWYNQTEGTIYLQAQCLAAITAQTYLAIDNGTSNNLITVRTSPSNATFERSQVVDGGVTQAALGAGGYTATSINDFAFAYKANDFARSVNGSSVATDTSGTIPTVNQMFIGSERGQYFVNGHIRRIVHYPTRLSNEELRALTLYSRNVPLWTPAQISTALWLDAADANTITLNGSTVSQWADKSGNARNAVQATAANQPTYVTNAINGLSVIRFNVAYNFLNLPSLTSLGTAATMVHAQKTTDALYKIFNNTNASWALAADTSDTVSPCRGPIVTTSTITINGSQFSGTSRQQYYSALNNTTSAIVADNANFSGWSTPAIGGYSSFGFTYAGDLLEIVFISSALSVADRQKLEGYLAWKWGFQANLPASHPYKNNPPTAL